MSGAIEQWFASVTLASGVTSPSLEQKIRERTASIVIRSAKDRHRLPFVRSRLHHMIYLRSSPGREVIGCGKASGFEDVQGNTHSIKGCSHGRWREAHRPATVLGAKRLCHGPRGCRIHRSSGQCGGAAAVERSDARARFSVASLRRTVTA